MAERLEPHDYQMALASQSACNLSGIVHSFSQVISKIWEDVRAEGGGTDQVNRHPISVLYGSQIGWLSSACLPAEVVWEEAKKICEERSKMASPTGRKP